MQILIILLFKGILMYQPVLSTDCKKIGLTKAMLVALLTPCFLWGQSINVEEKQRDTPSVSEVDPLQLETFDISADASANGLSEVYRGGQVARGARIGILGNQDMMDSSFVSTAYTSKMIQDTQAQSVSDVVRNDPSVQVARGFGNFQEVYVIRGFPIYSDDMMYNGLYGILPRQYVSTEFLERVEVFRGANSFLNGAAPGGSGIGGAINLLPKRAGSEPLTRLSTGVQSGGEWYTATDLARRFGDEQQFGVRLNAARHKGDTAIRREHRKLDMLSLGLDYHTDTVRLSSDLGYQDQRLDQPRPSVTPSGSGVLSVPNAKENYGQPWTYSMERQTFGTFRGEWDILDNVTGWAALGMRKGTEHSILSGPTAQDDGSFKARRSTVAREDTVLSGDMGFMGNFMTGPISHQWAISHNLYNLRSRNAYAWSANSITGNIYYPNYSLMPTDNSLVGGDLSAPHVTDRTQMHSTAIVDTVGLFEDTLLLTAGLRRQNLNVKSYNYNTGNRASSYNKGVTTPMYGLVYKFNPEFSFYANHIEGLAKGDIAPSVSGGTPVVNAGEALTPYRSRQTEFGLKYDGENIGGSLSYFTTKKPFSTVKNGYFSAGGKQRNQGVELMFFGELVESVRLLGGITYIHAKQIKVADQATKDKYVIGVPKYRANLNAEWDIPFIENLAVNTQVMYTAKQYVNATNTLQVPSWTRVDLGARYLIHVGKQKVTLRAKVENVANRKYWASVGGYAGANYLTMGDPRTYLLSMDVDF